MGEASIEPKDGLSAQAEDREISEPSSVQGDGDVEKQEATVPEKEKPSEAGEEEDESQYPSRPKVIVIMMCLYMAVFLLALDRTIIATAIPRMTDDFHSFGDIGWYGSAFLFTQCAFQLFFGRVYTFYSPKWVFLALIVVFEVGSAVCGAAPTSTAFIIGRAVAGLGSAGIFSGAIVIMIPTVPLRKRPMYQGFVGAVFGVASVAGPLLGGAFTTNVSWRWCFYINLPIGGLTMVLLYFVLDAPAPRERDVPLRDQIRRLDPLGTFLFIPSIVCLLLALQWGGSTYPWNSGRIIALLVVFAVLLMAFIGVQLWMQENATIPPHIIKQRSIAAGFLFTNCLAAAMLTVVYFIPVWFQAIKGVSAEQSGVMNLPLLLGLVFASILTGITVSKVGYYTPFMIVSAILMATGAGLLTTFTTTTAHPKWIGYQALFGLGIGMGMQQGSMAAQTVLKPKDVPTGVSVMIFGISLGSSLFISVGQNILSNRLISGLSSIPHLKAHFPPASIVNVGATQLRKIFPKKYLPLILEKYNIAVTDVFFIAVGTACVAFVGAILMEWKSVKGKKKKKPGQQ